MTDAEIFDNFLRRNGRGFRFPRHSMSQQRWDISYGLIEKEANNLITSARTYLPGLPHIHFDFAHNDSIGACAFKCDGRYFIAFNSGTRYMLQLLFCRMLSDPRLFDFIASPIGEDTTLTPLKYSVRAEEMYQAGIRPIPPKTFERMHYSQMSAHSAFRFLIGHEIAHITLGHVDYFASKTGTAFVSELGWNLPTDEDILERQAMEAAADYRSVYSAIESLRLTNQTHFPESPEFLKRRHTLENLLFDWSFAMNTACRIFGDIVVDESELEASSYPPFPLRRFLNVVTAGSLIAELWKPSNDERNKYFNALKHGTMYTELAFMKIQNKTFEAKGYNQVFGPLGAAYGDKVLKYIHNILSIKLKPFAYEGPFYTLQGESIDDALKRAKEKHEHN